MKNTEIKEKIMKLRIENNPIIVTSHKLIKNILI
jgi:hypothetical protein